MTFVPIVPVSAPHASPNAQELGRRIATQIHEYQQNHPDTSRTDIRQALKIAELSTGGTDQRKAVLIAVVVAVLLVGLLFGFLQSAGSLGRMSAFPSVALIAGAVVVLIVARLVRSSR